MNYKKFLVAVLLSLVVVCPVFSENKKENKENQQTDEIENFDCLYNNEDIENYDYASVDNMLDEAFSHLGARYRSGQAGPYAFDCSGFTSYVFKNMGVELSRSSRSQYTQGEPVSKNDLQCGDLVFFTDLTGTTTAYSVVMTEVLDATAIHEMLNSSWALTLYTCTYGGQDRVAVRCERMEQ